MRRIVRVLLATLILGAGLVTLNTPTPVEAQAAPDGICTTPLTCADEAAAVGWSAIEVLTGFEAGFSWAQIQAAGDEGLCSLMGYAAGCGLDDPAYCVDLGDLGGVLGCGTPPETGGSDGWANAIKDELEFAAMSDSAKRFFCALWGSWDPCARWLAEQQEENPPPEGNEEFASFPGGATYTGPAMQIWTGKAGAADSSGGLSGSGWTVTETVGDWTSGTGWPTAEGIVLMWEPAQGYTFKVWVQFGHSTAGWTGATAPNQYRIRMTSTNNSGGGGAFRDSGLSGWSPYDPGNQLVAFGLRQESGYSGGGSSTWRMFVPGWTGSPFSHTWTLFHTAGREGPNATCTNSIVTCTQSTAQYYASITQAQLTEKLGLFDPSSPRVTNEPAPYVPPEFEYPFEDAPTQAPPIPDPTPTPTIVPAPQSPPVTNTPTTETPGDTQESWFDRLGNRIGGMFDNLGSLIGSSFGWLGGLLRQLFQWLVDRLWQMFKWLFDSLADLLEWLGSLLGLIYQAIQLMTQALGQLLQSLYTMLQTMLDAIGRLLLNILGAIGTLPALLVEIAQWIAALPSLIWDAFEAGLAALFIPTTTFELPACADIFPCPWVTELVGATTDLQAGIAGHGGCTAPTIGWSEFGAQLPAPSGCSGATTAGASNAGDLFGWRTPLRAVLTLGLWLGFFAKVLRLAPWGRDGDMPLSGAEVTV